MKLSILQTVVLVSCMVINCPATPISNEVDSEEQELNVLAQLAKDIVTKVTELKVQFQHKHEDVREKDRGEKVVEVIQEKSVNTGEIALEEGVKEMVELEITTAMKNNSPADMNEERSVETSQQQQQQQQQQQPTTDTLVTSEHLNSVNQSTDGLTEVEIEMEPLQQATVQDYVAKRQDQSEQKETTVGSVDTLSDLNSQIEFMKRENQMKKVVANRGIESSEQSKGEVVQGKLHKIASELKFLEKEAEHIQSDLQKIEEQFSD